ncbi:MAG: ammonium transporter, partial [Chloroflexi bacterium]|nr:ammonium transporter [Chloroflexota bacterium]
GALSTLGFAVIQSRLEGMLKMIDTCGVTNLHGMPGLMGGIAAIFVVDGISTGNQLAGIGVTILVALVAGYLTGLIVSAFGRRVVPYIDSEEFLDAEA